MTLELTDFLLDRYFARTLPDGRFVSVEPLTFGRARLCVSESEDAQTYTDGW